MRVLVPMGIVLLLAGAGGTMASCYQSSRDASEQVEVTKAGPTGGVPSERTDGPSATPLWLATLSGLAMASGVGCIAVGAGRWNHPIPSYTRPANPWSDQPGERGEPPTGLV